MRVLSVEMERFRHHAKAARFDLDGGHVLIRGDNGRGKTTIAEAITYGLFGVNLDGSPRVDNLIHTGARSMRVAVRFVGHDGREHVVERGRTGRKSWLRLDGREVSQAEVERVAGPVYYFLPAFWPTTIGGWSDKEAREFFTSLLRPVEPEAVLEALSPAHREILAGLDLSSPETAAHEIREQVRETEREIERLRGRIEGLRGQDEPIPEVTEEDVSAELDRLLAEYEALEAPDTSALEAEVRRLDQEVARARAELAALQRQIEDPDALADTCPTCGQPLPEGQLEKARKALEERNEERRREMERVVRRGREAAARRKMLEQQIAALKAQADSAHREELARKIDELRQRQQVYRLQVELRAQALGRRQQREREIAEAEKAVRDREAALGRYRQELDALKDFVAKQAELQVGQLAGHLKRVSVQLHEISKTTGELRPVFRLLFDGRPYAVLSTSERIRVGLEVATLINSLTGLDFPVFVDNAESVTSWERPAASQVFEARVAAGEPLSVRVVEVA